MALSEGLLELRKMRGRIQCLWDRRHYLLDKIEDKKRYGLPVDYERAEVFALEWAIELMEDAWDNAARLHRNVRKVEQKLHSAERSGKDQARYSTPEWEVA